MPRPLPAWAGWLAALAAPAAPAAPLLISPTTVQLAPGRHAAVVTVENGGDAPVDLQFTAFAWSQRDGADLLAETADVVVSPAIATVAPHGRQLFRILERGAADGAERSYRLRLAELPRDDAGAVAVRLGFLLPMFGGGAAVAAAPGWSLAAGRLTVANDGNRRVRLGALALRLADGRTVALPVPQPTYLLAGSRRSWPVPAATAAAGARLVGATDTGSFDVPSPAVAPVR